MEDIVVITGCNRGIGFSIANNLLLRGFKVVGLNRTSSEIIHKNYEEHKYNSSFTDEELDKLVDKIPAVKFLILNAGYYYEKDIEKLDTEFIKSILLTNSVAPYSLLTRFTNKLSESNGRVISIGSRAEYFIMPDSEFYSISKLAFKGMLKAYSPILSSRGISLSHYSLPRIGPEGLSVERLVGLIYESICSPSFTNMFIDL